MEHGSGQRIMTAHTPAQETAGAVAGLPTWGDFLDVARAQTASRTRPFFGLGIVLVFMFTGFDIFQACESHVARCLTAAFEVGEFSGDAGPVVEHEAGMFF